MKFYMGKYNNVICHGILVSLSLPLSVSLDSFRNKIYVIDVVSVHVRVYLSQSQSLLNSGRVQPNLIEVEVSKLSVLRNWGDKLQRGRERSCKYSDREKGSSGSQVGKI